MSSIMTRREVLSAAAGIVGIYFTKSLFATGNQYDGITSATASTTSIEESTDTTSKVLLVLVSFHHKNTEKIANEIAKVLNAQINTPQQINIEKLQEYDLIGFGSGIYDQKHHKSLLGLVDGLTQVDGKKAFIFSTSGISREFAIKNSIEDPHKVLREKLQTKGYAIVDEFNCAGWNTNSFLKVFGGINWGRPNGKDLKCATRFAEKQIMGLRK